MKTIVEALKPIPLWGGLFGVSLLSEHVLDPNPDLIQKILNTIVQIVLLIVALINMLKNLKRAKKQQEK